ncbi:MAG: ATP-binding cassette domain-containing protein [Acidobacteriota bacterium]
MSRGRVRVENGNVVSDRGTPLRGGSIEIFLYAQQTGASAYVHDPAFYKCLRRARLNALRVGCFDAWQRSHEFPHWDLEKPDDRGAFLAELDRVVQLAGQHDLYALVDYHDVGRYDLSHLELFWDVVAPRYANETHVLFELANEPVSWCPENYTDETLRELEGVYQRIRRHAPDTHVALLSFANVAKTSPPVGDPMGDVVSRMRGIDWSNASVAIHPYGQLQTSIITKLREKAPVIVSEIDLPAHAGATAQKYLYTSLDNCEYGIEALERIGVSWFSWGIGGPDKLKTRFIRGVLLDAAEKGYLWEPDLPQKARAGDSSAILAFFRTLPVAEMSQRMGMKPKHIAACVGLAVLAALLDGAMLASLIPISRGAMAGNFDFLWTSGALSGMRDRAPATLTTFLGTFIALGIAVFFVGVLKNAAIYALHLATGRLYGIYSAKLANSAFQRYLSFGRSYYTGNNTGKMAAIIDYNHDLLNLFKGLLRIVATVPVLLVHLSVMVLISWRSTLALLLIFVPLHLIRRWIARKTTGPIETSQARTLRIAGKAFDALRAAPLFRAYAKEDRAVQSHAGIMEELREADFQVWVYSGFLPRMQDVITLLGLLTILVFALAFDRGGSSIAAAFVFFFAARLAIPHLSVFHEVDFEFAQKMPRMREFFDIFNDHGKYVLPSGPRQLEGIADSVRFQGLTFAYPDREAVLHDVSFSIKKGKVTALVGPSGSGKSTLAALLLRYHDVPPHKIVFDGTNIREFDTASLRRSIAFVSQDVILLDDTLRNNLVFGRDEAVSEDELSRAVTDACLDEVVESLPQGLDTTLGADGLTLSGGQRQRVAIARAMLKKAPILILDEATSSLDSLTERQVQVAMDNLLRECTSLVIAHRLSTIQRADHVVVLDSGRVVEQGTAQELLEMRGRFHEMWEAQRFE